ncbi:conserved hypothetical protein [Dellaglioa algida]|nr:hypothetical protein [Dellaglioa algida]SOB51148.1 conserved hypothetical protein [Dellaglioa algida]
MRKLVNRFGKKWVITSMTILMIVFLIVFGVSLTLGLITYHNYDVYTTVTMCKSTGYDCAGCTLN